MIKNNYLDIAKMTWSIWNLSSLWGVLSITSLQYSVSK